MLKKEKLENLTNEVWKGAISLRGKFKASEYPAIILPMIMLRRIECVLAEQRKKIKETYKTEDENKIKTYEKLGTIYNTTNWTLKSILEDDPSQVDTNFINYLNNFTKNIDEIINKFDYKAKVQTMVKEKRLVSIMKLMAEQDFSLERLSNLEMGYVYENLIQMFSQDDAKGTGEHFTPREIIRIMVDLLEIDFDPEKDNKEISLYDPACGTGGMLSVAKEHLINKAPTENGMNNVSKFVNLYGQELLSQNYAICKADMILKGERVKNITHGNSLIPDNQTVKDDGDQLSGKDYKFDYMLSNPPFGVNWADYKDDVARLSSTRYQQGMPPVSDGALLFLLTMLEKVKPITKDGKGGSKIAILFNGSPLSNGDATSSESEIRRHILEKNLLDTIVMLPDQMFFNTGIFTYIWLLNTNKPKAKKDKVLIINARNQFEKEPKSFGNKRNRITDQHRQWIHQQFNNYQDNDDCKLFHIKDFAFHKVALTFWQQNENGEQMWITEAFDKDLTNGSMKTVFEKYDDFTIKIKIDKTTIEFQVNKKILKLKPKDKTTFESVLAKKLESSLSAFKDLTPRDAKTKFKYLDKTVAITRRHYIDDVEYIPFDREAKNKKEYISNFLSKEIEYKIIRWHKAEQLGYEFLPNKYFYKYQAPKPSDDLLQEFWWLENEAKNLLDEIKDLG